MSVDLILGNSGTLVPVTLGGSVDGLIDSAGDQDWYRVSLVAGQQYRFELRGDATPPASESALANPLLRLLSTTATGNVQLALNDNADGSLNSSITFNATQTGDHFLSAQGFGSATGAFTLTAVNVTAGDVAGNTGTGATVAVGGSAIGTLGFGGDQDWYRVDLVVGRTYRFDLQGQSSGQGTLADPLLRLLNGAGTQLASNDDAGLTLDSSITFTATQSGAFFLSAQGSAGSVGTFRIAVADLTATGADVPGSTASVATLVPGTPVNGSVGSSGDQDWYRVSLTAGNSYSFTLQGSASGQGTLSDPFLRLLDGTGTQLAFNDDSGGTLESSLSFTAAQNGIHYLSAQAFGSDIGSFRLSATNLGAGASDVAGNTGPAAGVVAIGGSVAGSIGLSGDQDWYAVTLTGGHQYRFDLRGSSSSGGTLVDPLLRLLNSAGSQIEVNDDAGGTLDSSIAFSPLANGTYYLSAQDFFVGTGSFTLSATEITGGAGDVAANVGSSAGVAIGGAAAGTIDVGGDQDWFRVSLLGGQTYRFDLRAVASGAGTLVDPLLRLLSGQGAELASNDDAGLGLESQIFFTPSGNGIYYLSAQGFGSNQGTYRLEAGLVSGTADAGSSTGTAGAMFVGGSVAGTITAGGDQDWYAVSLVAGRSYVFELQGFGAGNGTLVDPFLRLLSSVGAPIVFNDDDGAGLDARLAFQATQTGIHYLSAESFAGFGGGTFVLSATDVTSAVDVLGGTGTGATVLMGGAVAGVIGPDNDQDWFQVSLVAGHRYAFDLFGAPAGPGELADPLLRLLNGSGVQLDFSDDVGSGFDANLVYTATQSGIHYLAAEGYSGSTGSYSLRAFDFDDPGEVGSSTTTAGRLAVGGTLVGTIDDAGDHDWYQISFVAGHQYLLELRGVDSGAGGGSLADPVLRMVDQYGDETFINGYDFALNDSFGTRDAIFVWGENQNNTYFLSAEALGSSTGTYTIRATDLNANTSDISATTETLGALAVNGLLTGLINGDGQDGAPGLMLDFDWYRISLVAGHQYQFDLQGAHLGLGTLSDPWLRLWRDTGGGSVSFEQSNNDVSSGFPVNLDSRITFNAAVTGTYYLSAEGNLQSDLGSYRLSATDLTQTVSSATDLVPGNNTSAVDLFTGNTVFGNINFNGDQDWYRIFLTEGRQYGFVVQAADTLWGTLANPRLRLLDASGAQLASDDDSGIELESFITYTAEATGFHYLSAEAVGALTGTFKISADDMTPPPAGDVLGNARTDGVIALGGSVAGAIDSANDQDWFQIVLSAGQTYRFELRGAESEQGTLVDPVLRLMRDVPNGSTTLNIVQQAINDDGGAGLESSITYIAPSDFDPTDGFLSTATFFLSAQGAGVSTGSYVLSAALGADGGAPASIATQQSIAVGASVNGTIDTIPNPDQDWYRVELLAGHDYQFDLKGSSSSHGTLFDPVVRLLDGAGAQVALDDQTGPGNDARLSYTPGASGTYYLSAQSFTSGTYGSYTLNATDLGSSEIAANTDTRAAIGAFGGRVEGTIDRSGDEDWYAVSLVAFNTYEFELKGAASNDGTLGDPYLRLLNSAGNQVVFDNDSGIAGNNARVGYMPLTTGTYYLSAQGFADSEGSYLLSSINSTVLDVIGGSSTPALVPVGGEVTGTIGTTVDQDWYKVSLVPQSAYLFELRGLDSSGGTLGDPYLRLYNSAGTSLLGFDDDAGAGRDSSLVFVAPGTGPFPVSFYLSAEGFFGSMGTFTLGVTEVSSGNNVQSGLPTDDVRTGGPLKDVLFGGAGNDRLQGKAGDDLLSGDAGNDTLSGGEGDDGLFGGDGDDVLLQTALESQGDDVLLGEAGNDSLSDLAGINSLNGGEGDDRFIVDSADDALFNVATGGAGRDSYVVMPRSLATANFTWLVSDFELGLGGDLLDVDPLLEASAAARFYTPGVSSATAFVRLLQSGTDTLLQWDRDGSGSANAFVTLLALINVDMNKLDSYNFAGVFEIGTKLDDELFGAGGNDSLVGADGDDDIDGGAGADRMVGGYGEDTYHVDDPKDEVVETNNNLPGGPAGVDLAGAIDRVIARISYGLGAFIENLTLVGTANLIGTGNTLDNVLAGNNGNNLLNGNAGADTMAGGLGNDTFVVNSVLDRVTEALNAGTDLVQSTATAHTLSANVENLTLTGTAAINGTGNTGNNVLTGNSGNNVLNGGAGADTMAGGLGNDTFVVNSVLDAVTEAPSAGTDLVQSSATAHTLSANVENLTLTGAGAISGAGNTGDNVLTGNTGKNTLNGGSGNDTLNGALGNDTMAGGTGADAFLFASALGAANIDRVVGFSVVADTIRLENAIFASLVTPGALAAASFRAGAGFTTAADANDFIIFNTSNGQLFYDAGGNTGAASQHFATLTGVVGVVTAADFLIV